MALGGFLAVLALCSVNAADPNCTALTSHLKNLNQIIGKWIVYAETSDSEKMFAKFQADNSSWMEITPTDEDNKKTVHMEVKEGEKCFVKDGVATVLGDKLKLTLDGKPFGSEHIGHYMSLDDDALMWSGHTTFLKNKGTGKTLLLFTKNGTLADATWQRFNTQATCLGFTKFHFLESTDLCPVEKTKTD